jgi:hypothetical protein
MIEDGTRRESSYALGLLVSHLRSRGSGRSQCQRVSDNPRHVSVCGGVGSRGKGDNDGRKVDVLRVRLCAVVDVGEVVSRRR